MRSALGHPLPFLHPVKVIVASISGMDGSLPDRATIAARLCAEGISTEYIPQSGVMMSLLKHKSSVLNEIDNDTNVS